MMTISPDEKPKRRWRKGGETDFGRNKQRELMETQEYSKKD